MKLNKKTKSRLQELAGVKKELPTMKSMLPKYKLRYSESDTFIIVNIEKLLKQHVLDNPSYAFNNREGADHPGRIEAAKQFWLDYCNDDRFIDFKTGDRNEYSKVYFEAPLVSIDYGKLGFSDGRHRVIAMKEIGYKNIIIEIPKEQIELFKNII